MMKILTRSLKKPFAAGPIPVFLLILLLILCQAVPAGSPGKNEKTGTFCQMDPGAGFENEGSNYCAPTSIANGLIYLATARGLKDLVDGTDHKAQIALIKKLADEMDTDPDIGTNPSKIIDGLESYLDSKGYSFARLEVAGWRNLNDDHEKYLVSKKPDMKWIRSAVEDPDTVVILNNGWYRDAGGGGYTRKGGHFVIAVGAGPKDSELQVHNPALESDEQKTETSVTMALIDDNTVAEAKANGVEELELDGYYKMEGPGLPYTSEKAAFAALDFVIIFKLKKE
ncbi:MAG: hypothetical protein RDV48_14560 [Candidatus Eremiobacteraeota bacterium]|nr:hypothetical protein [Candidatus Eremiobacteraeota bacterium]